MSTRLFMMAAAAAFATLAGGIGAANAHGHGGHGNHFFNHHHGLRIIGGGYGYGYEGCGYFFNRWQYSGSYYWKRRFLSCKYGY